MAYLAVSRSSVLEISGGSVFSHLGTPVQPLNDQNEGDLIFCFLEIIFQKTEKVTETNSLHNKSSDQYFPNLPLRDFHHVLFI